MLEKTSERIHEIIHEIHIDNFETINKNIDIYNILGRLYEYVHEKDSDNIKKYSESLDMKLGCKISEAILSEIKTDVEK